MSVREGYKQTEIGVIPEGWEVTSVRDLTKLTSGKFNPKKNLLDTKSIEYKYPVYGGNGLTGYFDDFLIENPSIIIGRVGEYCGSVHLVNEPVWITDNAIYLKEVSDKVNLNFLFEVFTSIGIENLAERTGQPKITQEPIYSLKIPLPPLPEQQKIAAILTSVDNKIAVIDEQIAKTEQLKKGLMQKLLSEGIGHTAFKESEIGRIPKEWEVVRLRDIADVKGGKRLPKGHKLVETQTPYPYIRVRDMYMGGIKTDDIIYVPEEVQPKIKNYTIAKDDLFISVAGTLGLVGAVPDELDGANLTENADKLTNIKSDKIFLLYVLMSNLIQDIIVKETTTNAQPKLALTRIKTFLIPLPPINEQKQIATILSTTDNKLNTLRKKKSRYEKLKKGLMQKLLTGEVRVKI